MKHEDIKDDLNIFDDFVNKAISANIKGIEPIKIIRSYNKIRDFINHTIEFDKDEDKK